jgi:hypothetical protein
MTSPDCPYQDRDEEKDFEEEEEDGDKSPE